MDALKPCKFCGGIDVTIAFDREQGSKWGYAGCDTCGARGPEVRTAYDTAHDAPWHGHAIAEWNRSADLAADARPVQDDAASRRRKIMGYMDDKAAADARAEALKDAAALFDSWWICAPDGSDMTQDVQDAILALIPEEQQ